MEKILKFKTILILTLLIFLSSCASIKKVEYSLPLKQQGQTSIDIENDILKIVQISDLHSNFYGKNQEKLIEKILAAHPDLIVFTGDIFDFEWPLEIAVGRVEKVLSAIKDVCPFFYISGNHEYYYGHNNEYASLFTDYGGIVLANSVVSLEIKGMQVCIAGLDDPIATVPMEIRYSDAVDMETFQANVGKVSMQIDNLDGDLNILLAHRPEYIDLYKKTGVFDLILSGHAHGGQWRFPFINGIYAPGQGLFPKYAGGRYDFSAEQGAPENGGQTLVFIISRGLSYQKPPIPRFFNPVEMVEILVQTEAFRK